MFSFPAGLFLLPDFVSLNFMWVVAANKNSPDSNYV